MVSFVLKEVNDCDGTMILPDLTFISLAAIAISRFDPFRTIPGALISKPAEVEFLIIVRSARFIEAVPICPGFIALITAGAPSC
jgi:hypothetical protein